MSAVWSWSVGGCAVVVGVVSEGVAVVVVVVGGFVCLPR